MQTTPLPPAGTLTPPILWTLAATGVGFLVVLLDVTIVNVALPGIGAELASSVDGLQWIVDAYTLAFAGLLLSAGALGDRFGVRKAFLVGLVLFAIGSAACGLAPTPAVLIVARVVQGLGAAFMIPTSLALVAHACGDDHKARVRAIGLWSAAGSIAVGAGPVVGGVLVTHFGWRSIFLVNIPLCLVSVWLLLARVAEAERRTGRGIDLAGQSLAIVALLALTAAVIEAGSRGWSDTAVLAGFAIAAVAGIAFLVVESRVRDPMVPLGFFRHPTFSAGVAIGALLNVAFYGLFFVLSLYFQQIRGYSPAMTGAAFLPMTGAAMVSNLIGTWLATRRGFRLPIIGGLSVATVGYGLLFWLDAETSYLAMASALLMVSVGMGVVVPPMTSAVIASIARERSGTASAVLNTARQVGGAVGVALFGGFVAGGGEKLVSGVALAFGVSSALILLAAICAVLGIRAQVTDQR